jgi:O-antigen/teichoic acid export membrane protein
MPRPPRDAPTELVFDDDGLSADEVKSRAASGAALVMGRGALIQGLGFLGNLVLARLLVPEDFGLVALGLTVISVGRILAGAGLGSALIGREETPTKEILRAVTGLQLLVTSAVAGIAVGIAALIGNDAMVTAVMVLALPLSAFRTPAMVLFQRRLEFGVQVKIEIAEAVLYVAVAITLAAMGFGAWSLAIATVVRILLGTVLAIACSAIGFPVPSFQFGRLRSILGFGWRFGATGVTKLAQDTALIAGIAAVGGLGVLGLWTFAARLLAIPKLLFDAMWRVGFPAFSRLRGAEGDERAGALLERTVGTFAVGVSLLLCPLVASSPALVPLLFGSDWTDVSLILPGAGLAMAIAGPLGIVTSCYLYARGDASTGLVGTSITGPVRIAITLALLPPLGVMAIGIGWAVGTLAGTAYTLPRAQRASGARLLSPVLRPVVAAAAGATAGWFVADALGVNVVGAALSGLVGVTLGLLMMVVVARATLMDALAMSRTIFRSAFGSGRGLVRRQPAVVPSSGG